MRHRIPAGNPGGGQFTHGPVSVPSPAPHMGAPQTDLAASAVGLKDLHGAYLQAHTPEMSVTHLSDLFDIDEYEAAVAAGYVRVRPHPSEPLLIHNYTQACTWDGAWSPVTITCRGLITHAETGMVVARPFQKFFNHGQPEAPMFRLDDEVVVMEKADGSLAVHYPTSDGYAIATRGSFTSAQALWATGHYQAKYADSFKPNPRWTYLYEIIAPQNRIVVDYGDMEDLVLLGAVETSTGRTIPVHEAAEGWPGPTVEVFPHGTFEEVLNAPERRNKEGFVVWRPSTDSRLKIKHSEYLRIHKLIYGVNERHVWEVLANGDDLSAAFRGAPDEFHDWVRKVSGRLSEEYSQRRGEIEDAYSSILSNLPEGFSRKEYAEVVARHPLKSFLFLQHDGRSVDELIWRAIRPSGENTLRAVNPDAD